MQFFAYQNWFVHVLACACAIMVANNISTLYCEGKTFCKILFQIKQERLCCFQLRPLERNYIPCVNFYLLNIWNIYQIETLFLDRIQKFSSPLKLLLDGDKDCHSTSVQFIPNSLKFSYCSKQVNFLCRVFSFINLFNYLFTLYFLTT